MVIAGTLIFMIIRLEEDEIETRRRSTVSLPETLRAIALQEEDDYADTDTFLVWFAVLY